MTFRVLVACLAVAGASTTGALAQPAQSPVAAKSSGADLQSAVGRLRPIVKDIFATEAALSAARAELQALAARAEQLAAENAGREDAAGPASAVQLEIRDLLATIGGRLGAAPGAGVTSSAPLAAMPVPEFEEGGDVRRESALALRQAQANFREHLRNAPADAQRSEDLLVEMILAEERLAWQAGWPFTANEAAALKSVIGSDKASGASNEVQRRIVDVYARRRQRGIAAINRELRREAASVGRAAPALFVVHRPTAPGAQRVLERRLAELIANALDIQVQPSAPALMPLAKDTRLFDHARIAILRGNR